MARVLLAGAPPLTWQPSVVHSGPPSPYVFSSATLRAAASRWRSGGDSAAADGLPLAAMSGVCAPPPLGSALRLRRGGPRSSAVAPRAAASNPLQALQALFATQQREAARTRAKAALRAAIAGTERGLLPSAGGRAAVEAAVDALAALAAEERAAGGGAATDAARLSATWRLLWTSERETLFLLQKGLPFVGAARESYQVIDVRAGTLANVVEFGDDGAAFVVDARIEVQSPVRCGFRFAGAALRRPAPAKPLALPPFGAGWFDNLYVDAQLRVARDSRGDTLVVERSATPWLPK